MSALPIQSTVDQLLSAGLTLSLTPESGLKVAPASGITPALRDLIRTSRAALVDYLQLPIAINTEAANDNTEPFKESPGFEGTGWRLAGADGLSPATLAKFRAASLALDAHQSANNLQIQGVST
jgi:hypothetical protein